MKIELRPALVSLIILLGASNCRAQVPSFLWSTNLGARVSGVDDHTNVYLQADGNMIKLSGSGVPLETNVLSVNPGFAQRDSSGNLYYAGHYPGTFVGTGYTFSTPACFLAKFNSAGSLLWSVDFGPAGYLRAIRITDLEFDTENNPHVGYTYNVLTTELLNVAVKFDGNGTNVWSATLPNGVDFHTQGTVRFGALSPTNVFVLGFWSFGPSATRLFRLDSNGAIAAVAAWSAPSVAAWTTERPVSSSLPEFFDVEAGLTKRGPSGNLLLTQNTPNSQWTVGEDHFGGVHVADDNGLLSRYDYDGNLVWSTNLPARVTGMVLDAAGNRFISLTDGSVARLSNELVSAPIITNSPPGRTVLVGSNVVFNVEAGGSGPLRYFWLFNNNPLPGQTNTSFSLTGVTTAQAGLYSVIVSNFAGSITSTPALLRVKWVALYAGAQLLTNGTYVFYSTPTLSVHSSYTNGSSFYTLDGSAPTFTSRYYSVPFTLSRSATVRALGYSADFSQSEEADAVVAVVVVTHTLRATSSGVGSVTLNPPGGTYFSTNVVTATAVPAAGWSFLYWLGDAPGNSASINVSMERDKTLYAVFGTALSTTVAGNGQVQLFPPGGVYPYGTVVRLTGVPQPGNYFGFWGNAATGNANPLYFTINTPNATVSSIFGATPANQSSLTVLINGNGRVTASPTANLYSTNQTVTLTAVPDAGQAFLNWSGDASAAQNPLSVSMAQSKVVSANFSARPQLRAYRAGIEGLTPDGFRFTLISQPALAWEVLVSDNLTAWQPLGIITNSQGEVQFLDSDAVNLPSRFYRAVLAP